MAGYATDSRGREFVAIITVEQRNNEVSDIELLDVAHAVNGRQKNSSQADTKSQGVYPIKAAKISINDFIRIVKQTHQSVLSNDVLEKLGETRNPKGTYAKSAKFSASSEKRTAESMRDEVLEAMPSFSHTPHSVPRNGREESKFAEKMTDEERAVVEQAMEKREKTEKKSIFEMTIEEMMIPKEGFTSTPAIDKLGVKVAGSVARYRSTEDLKAYQLQNIESWQLRERGSDLSTLTSTQATANIKIVADQKTGNH